MIDDAISRGRTLNTIEVLLKTFYSNADWKIGFLYSPNVKIIKNNLINIITKKRIPICANRPDIIGLFIVEDSKKFIYINPFDNNSFQKKHNININKNNHEIISFIINQLGIEKKYVLKYKNNIIQFIRYLACEKDLKKIKKCLNLTPVFTKYWIEEMNFYLNQPNPLDNIEQRSELKKILIIILNKFTTKHKDKIFLANLKRIRNHIKLNQKTYRSNCVNLWYKQHLKYQITLKKTINLLLKNKQRRAIVKNYLIKSKTKYGHDFNQILLWVV